MRFETFLTLKDCSFKYTKSPILKEISFSIHNQEKIALIGKNGVGKSTLMRILNKEKEPESGEIWFNPNLKISYLKQKNNIISKSTVNDYLKNYFKENDYEFNTFRIENYCKKLKINQNNLMSELSGGLIRKIGLLKILVDDGNFLLLDEPTNHLDIESIRWLENFLNNEFKGSFLVVSHDRKFLKNVTNKVFWMDRGKIKVSPKGFSNFEDWSQSLIEQESRELKNKRNFLKQELDWLSKGIKARRKRNERRLKNVKSLEKDFKEEQSDFLKAISNVKFNIADGEELGPNVVVQLFNISKSYNVGQKNFKMIENFNYKFVRGERIGIIGKNGVGKSTFLNIILKKISPDIGSVKFRSSISYSYFDQNSEQIIQEKTIKENLIPNGGDYIEINGKKKHICGYLKNFLFKPNEVNDKVSSLSGGQKNRILLAKVLASPKNLLILDEPTNDLDLETLDMLIKFLENYKGTILIASHDRDFLDKCCKKIFFFHGNGIIEISNQSCSDVLEKFYSRKKKLTNLEPKITKSISSKKTNNTEKEIKKILKKIEKLEENILRCTEILENSNLYIEDKQTFISTGEKLKNFQYELNLLEQEWRNLEEENIKDTE